MKTDLPKEVERIGKEVVDSAYKVHHAMGPGLLESIYESCLVKELSKRGLSFERQKNVTVHCLGEPLDEKLRLDLLVADQVIVEVKSVEALLPIFDAQLMTYLKVTGRSLGFLFNFNVRWMKNGIKRVVYTKR
ncbi:MAG TPA: GxxExxY protein [bacterium]|nr:GxxExxY protein [bacterium]